MSTMCTCYDLLCLSPQLAKHYGNVYSIYIGPRPAVVINGVQALKEAFVTKAADFSGRPRDLMVTHAVIVKGCSASLLSFVELSDISYHPLLFLNNVADHLASYILSFIIPDIETNCIS